MKIDPKELTFLYRTVMVLLVLFGLALFVILCFIVKVYLPACVEAMRNVPTQFGVIW